MTKPGWRRTVELVDVDLPSVQEAVIVQLSAMADTAMVIVLFGMA